MKYQLVDYIDCGFYGIDDCDIQNYKSNVVKCRKKHECLGGCNAEIQIGEQAFFEKGFMDGNPVSCYTCIPCMDKWLDEINGDESEDEQDGL